MSVPARARFVAQVAASALALAACAAITGVDDLVENGGEPDARPIVGADAAALDSTTERDRTIANDAVLDTTSAPEADACGPAMLLFDEEFDGGTLNTTTRWTAA
jgi:hypothetical protein